MKRWIALLVLVVAAVCIAGCSGGFPFKWKPTEQQKQAADLTVKDIQALTPHVASEAEPLRREAQQAAEITQTYLGLPEERPQPMAQVNPQVLSQAQTDAGRPAPTIGQVGTAIVQEAEQITSSGFALAELLLTAAGSIAGVWGLGKVKKRFDGLKDRAGEAELKAGQSFLAIQEIVRGIDQLKAETKSEVKAAQHQSRQTERFVADAKRS